MYICVYMLIFNTYFHLHMCMRRRLCARCAVHKHINHAYKKIWDQTASAYADEHAGTSALTEPLKSLNRALIAPEEASIAPQ